ncbi:MAG: hypothetical protein WKF75_02265, partial [Singulisphaera sp.]
MENRNVSFELQGRPFTFAALFAPPRARTRGASHLLLDERRRLRRRPPGPNFPCVDHWWAAMEMIGGGRDRHPDQPGLGRVLPLVNTARSLQDVYLDARLAPDVGRRYSTARWGDRSVGIAGSPFSLPADEADRLRAVAHARDTVLVRDRARNVFLGPSPVPSEMPAFEREAYAWIRGGVDALAAGDAAGLAAHVATLGRKIAGLRRRGGDDRSRRFLNRFAYQSKVAFYLCYANAWIGLIPRLRAHRGLDAAGERLLRLWHHQNQPGDDDTAGPGGGRDAFCGQVLSLHPLSAFVMNDPAHLQALGAWIAHPEHHRLVAHDRVGT